MNWIKKNWISLVAIALSTVAISLSFFRFTPFVFTESWLNWSLSIIVGIVGIAVSVALVTQIWTAMQVEKLMDKKIKDIRVETEVKLKNLETNVKEIASELEFKSLNLSTCTSMYVMGQVKAFMQDYDGALSSFLLAIKSAKEAGRYDLCDLYANQALSFFVEIEQKAHIWMSSEEKNLQIQRYIWNTR